MQQYLEQNYQFRVNMLRECTEWRRSSEETWRELNDKSINTIYFELLNAGLQVGFKDVDRYLFSDFIPPYHPFHDYLSHLPKWDGRDRVSSLARRVSKDNLWLLVFHRWMLAMVAQWSGRTMLTANAMVPILISQRQGLGKSTFWRMIVPPELAVYYLDKLDFTATGEYDRMMAQCGLINLDELDSFSVRAMAKFKAATQMKTIIGHSMHKARITYNARLASFCATTNKVRILHDRTGSRRFFCVDVRRKINCSAHVNYAQLYAQLLSELEAGAPTWFSKQEERRIERNNNRFYALTPTEELLLTHFRIPDADGNEAVAELSSVEIQRIFARHHPRLAHCINSSILGKELSHLFPVVKRPGRSNLYRVVPLEQQPTGNAQASNAQAA